MAGYLGEAGDQDPGRQGTLGVACQDGGPQILDLAWIFRPEDRVGELGGGLGPDPGTP